MSYRIIVAIVGLISCGLSQAGGITVIAMQCEIEIPHHYKLDSRIEKNNSSIRFISSSSGFGFVSIGKPSSYSAENWTEKNKEKFGHLAVTEYVHNTVQGLSQSIITSFEQEIVLSGDAGALKNQIIEQCLATADKDKVNALMRESESCPVQNNLNLKADFPSLQEGIKFGVMRNIENGKSRVFGLLIRQMPESHQIKKYNVQSKDIIVNICGVTVAEFLQNTDSLCCSDPISNTVELTIFRKGAENFSIDYENP